ncbi:MAG: molybdenum cofactor guanylyltransferase [Algoriphagus sp.]|jgi:molybdopterin-guanine dinucleotide biosynthesis protein A|uniref:molybdenum cofactor guanylyltransferase n=1 Tax=Algoriphagus sp. TaxID=1872435 RepID=UPI0027186DB0|nr:molybdenum cofactor guanylyltransferase [Algoriphagus sp.]MDO8965143.1 molybdenum cofactor guanylyltransferase [Algoriphagus sp.]MDP2043288.1 molybdenum cofactor guanylyltransferase [Algoriphagus sp.]MDP3199217.1 molybdenum cofactor guanylyltransferase [Algoriphagus sp.]MDP3471198.1 molybdenum cofactor guanylyltransferase [Algoriphagus sp.]
MTLVDKSISVFILAGGKSSRMGEDKGLVILEGKPMISYLLETLQELELPVSIISNESRYEVFGVPVYPDLVKDKGPLGGIFTALCYSKSDNCLILSCDSPFLSKSIISNLLERAKSDTVLFGQQSGESHPFPGIYPVSVKMKLKRHLDLNLLKLQNFISEGVHQVILWDELLSDTEKAIVNFNTPADIQEWLEMIHGKPNKL